MPQRMRILILALGLSLYFNPVGAAEDAKKARFSPKFFGFDLSLDQLTPPQDKTVTTPGFNADPVVAQVVAVAGNERIVMLPSGRLVLRGGEACQQTAKKFVAARTPELAAELCQADALEGFESVAGRNFLVLHRRSEALARDSARLLDHLLATVQGFAKTFRLEVHDPAAPLPVILFPSGEAFRRYSRAPAGMVAFYDPVSNVVAVNAELAGDLKKEEAVGQLIATIAHEGTHQILHNIGVQQRLSVWPAWLSEGLAEYLAPTSLGERWRYKGVGQPNDLRLAQLERFLTLRPPDAEPGGLVRGVVAASRLTPTGYAASWGLVHYLAKWRREAFQSLLAKASDLGPFEGRLRLDGGLLPQQITDFEAIIGRDVVDLERRLLLHLSKLPYDDPYADQPHTAVQWTYREAGRVVRRVAVLREKGDVARWRAMQEDALSPAAKPTARFEQQQLKSKEEALRRIALWRRM